MPYRNKTGPDGQGSMTGRGLGRCCSSAHATMTEESPVFEGGRGQGCKNGWSRRGERGGCRGTSGMRGGNR